MSETPSAENRLRSPGDVRLDRVAGPCAIVLFGVTGDLARKKLLPAIYDLANRGLLPPGFALVGFGRREWSDEQFVDVVRESVREHSRTEFDADVWEQFRTGIRFVNGSFEDAEAYARMRVVLEDLRRERGTGGNTAFYLSVPPSSFQVVGGHLRDAGLAEADDDAWRRVVIEKPFGHDLPSAQELGRAIDAVFPPEHVFRIDHYLGKETVQNILALRFANVMYEPIWNSEYVDHVQITMAEDIGVAGRAGYYDGIGAARDVIQNHLLQLLALTAMEQPASLGADDLRVEKERVLGAVVLPEDLAASTARGQYASGWQGGEYVRGFVEEDGMAPDSRTETFAAITLGIDSPRWRGVPFYLRTGKRLARRVTEIAVVFKKPAFAIVAPEALGNNALVIRIQPDEGVTTRFSSKVPGPGNQLRDVTMDFGYSHAFTEASPEAYERLILDVLLGEPPLFPRQREVELSWRILDPIEAEWRRTGAPEQYASGSWGPEGAAEMLARDGRVWRRP
ncbi:MULTISPECIES: glucose-6-phosphate dehydrogenase [unclassified Leucobacter]|uniref:glucose-6-phosphate dehydrogenase n=1 Tax=unclassified Leucobacter TaxID=2621730 RepID=UPI00165E1D90|nr:MULTISPECIES: glucose-6-phosphate dehydrogenase [unclassified Leucobacter]MBC9935364.1 glucose-6-phosphate dehydrogenase [Leucobacter sp. cx-87]